MDNLILTRKYTLAEYEAILSDPEHRDRLLELVHGEIVEKVPTPEHAILAAAIATFLNLYVMQYNIGIVTVEARHQIENDNARLPDVALLLGENIAIPEKHFDRMPDLAVEIKSPADSYKSMREKADYYLQHGTRIVWLIYPEKKLVEVYRAGQDSDLLNSDDRLDGGDLLPDFQLPIAQLFAKIKR